MVNKKVKIIVFSPINVFPPIQGNQQDIFNRIKIFQEIGYEVVLIQFSEKRNENRPEIKNLKIINIEKERINKRFAYYRARGLETEENFKKVIKIIKTEKPDLLWFEYFVFAKMAEKIKGLYPEIKTYFRSHNYEFGHALEKWLDNFKRNKHIFSIPSFLLNLRHIKTYEKIMFKVSDRVFDISRLDVEKHKKKYRVRNVYYLPFFKEYTWKYKAKENKDKLKLFYFGSDFRNNVNLSGLEFIYKKIIPTLNNNKIYFHILGKNYPMNIKHSQIKFEGFIDNLDSFLENMDVSVVPIKIGYGMKIKAYESLKRGFPTIVSKRVDEVFGGRAGKDYFVARNLQDWKNYIALLFDKNQRIQVSKSCIEFMQKEFSKDKIISLLKQI